VKKPFVYQALSKLLITAAFEKHAKKKNVLLKNGAD